MALPETMKGWLLEDYKKPYVYHEDLPVPTARKGEVLIRVKAAGFCHSEMVHFEGGFPGGKVPAIPGHENVGIVVALGEGVTEFQVGDRVGTTLFRQTCDVCTSGTSNLCDTRENAGINSDGGMAEYMRADCNWTVKLPDAMSFEAAAPLMCAGSTIYNSILRAKRPKGSVIAIVGIGGLGYIGVQFAKAMGYKVVAVETREPPIQLLNALPTGLAADLIINPADGVQPALKAISEAFDGAPGVAAAIVSTDPLPAFSFATRIMAKQATMVVVGQPKEPIPFHCNDIIFRDMTIVAGMPSLKLRLQEMVDLVVSAGVRVEIKTYPLEKVHELIKDYHDTSLKGKLVLTID
ncbi:GroES-like protein [Ceratobasidium sp. AG-I]|nr:GroES-like protein [Ceratobasidium sp. AG-I]